MYKSTEAKHVMAAVKQLSRAQPRGTPRAQQKNAIPEVENSREGGEKPLFVLMRLMSSLKYSPRDMLMLSSGIININYKALFTLLSFGINIDY